MNTYLPFLVAFVSSTVLGASTTALQKASELLYRSQMAVPTAAAASQESEYQTDPNPTQLQSDYGGGVTSSAGLFKTTQLRSTYDGLMTSPAPLPTESHYQNGYGGDLSMSVAIGGKLLLALIVMGVITVFAALAVGIYCLHVRRRRKIRARVELEMKPIHGTYMMPPQLSTSSTDLWLKPTTLKPEAPGQFLTTSALEQSIVLQKLTRHSHLKSWCTPSLRGSKSEGFFVE